MGKEALFLEDSSEGKDGKLETLMDYFISWALRKAQVKYESENKPILMHYCRYMLGMLLFEKPLEEDTIVESVETWKQEDRIDLWVHVKLIRNGKEELHAILIEDKYYSKLHDNQLERYKVTFDSWFSDKPEWQKHYVLITMHDNLSLYDEAKPLGFKVLNYYDLQEENRDSNGDILETESDLYNEMMIYG